MPSPASGGCFGQLDQPAATFTVTCVHNAVDATLMHIHRGAAGVNGTIAFDLGSPTSPRVATWTGMTPADISDLLAGNLYLDVHTAGHPAGEIRGQILSRTVDLVAFTAKGAQVVPPNPTVATATCTADLDGPAIALSIQCTHDVPSPMEAHVHEAPAHLTGPVVFTFPTAAAPLSANVPMTPQLVADFAATFLYLDIHTAGSPQIRGQIGTPPPPGPVTHFSITTPASTTAGSAFDFTLTALDENVVTGYTGTVHFTTTDAGAGSTVPANYTFVGAGAGVKTLTGGATLVTAGNQTLTATDTVTASITGSSGNILVSAAAATHVSVTTPSSATTAGRQFSFTVTALDQFDNVATGYSGTMHFTSSDGAATLPADAMLTNGTGNFNATLQTAGSQTLTATDTVMASITGTSGAIAVSGAATTRLEISAPVAVDASPSGLAAKAAGTAFSLRTAGSQTITGTDTVSPSITGTSNAIVVAPGPATHFTLSVPGPVTSGIAFTFTVTALDQFNNVATGYTGTVHFTSSDSLAMLPADATLTNGTGSFSATLRTSGSHTLTATDTVNSSITGSATITFVAAIPTLSTWAFVLLTPLLALTALRAIRRRPGASRSSAESV